MKKFLVLALIAAVAFGAYYLVKSEMRRNLAFNSAVASFTDKAEDSFSAIAKILEKLFKGVKSAGGAFRSQGADGQSPVEAITIRLKHGGVISGKLIEKKKDSYTVEWNGAPFVISAKQIAGIERKAQRDVDWPYKNDVVVVKSDGVVLDGRIVDVTAERVGLSFPQEGGEAEMDVKRSAVDHLLFAPVCNRESLDIENRLKKLFPKMKRYSDGNITLFTDSYPTSANIYRKTLRGLYTDIYFKFYKLFRSRKPMQQCFVVVFDDFQDYVEYAITDGVPGWLVIGYFSPIDKTLYAFNAFGSRMEKMVFDVMVGKTGRSFDRIVEYVKSRVDSRYHIFVEGQAKQISDRFWDAYSLYKSELTDMTMSTLRHEFTHEIFNGWGLQAIVLSKPGVDKKKMTEKKREFLEAKDYRKKEELLMGLMRLKKAEYEGVEIASAQSWLSEGLATYCATDPVGSVDEEWLFTYQDAAAKKEVNPIEFLTNFKVGSFPGLVHKAALGSYAQSWALTSFLMVKYPDQFMAYQIKFATQKPKDGEEELQWLLSSLGKDLPALEKEFADYMNTYPKAEDPDVKRYMRYYKIWEDLLAS